MGLCISNNAWNIIFPNYQLARIGLHRQTTPHNLTKNSLLMLNRSPAVSFATFLFDDVPIQICVEIGVGGHLGFGSIYRTFDMFDPHLATFFVRTGARKPRSCYNHFHNVVRHSSSF